MPFVRSSIYVGGTRPTEVRRLLKARRWALADVLQLLSTGLLHISPGPFRQLGSALALATKLFSPSPEMQLAWE